LAFVLNLQRVASRAGLPFQKQIAVPYRFAVPMEVLQAVKLRRAEFAEWRARLVTNCETKRDRNGSFGTP
jgi:hypothetical protein